MCLVSKLSREFYCGCMHRTVACLFFWAQLIHKLNSIRCLNRDLVHETLKEWLPFRNLAVATTLHMAEPEWSVDHGALIPHLISLCERSDGYEISWKIREQAFINSNELHRTHEKWWTFPLSGLHRRTMQCPRAASSCFHTIPSLVGTNSGWLSHLILCCVFLCNCWIGWGQQRGSPFISI